MNPNTIPLQTTWSKSFQITHYKVPTYPAITNYRLLADLKEGDTVKRTFARQFTAKTMGGDGSYTRQAIVNTEESLVINSVKETSFFIKALDEIQSHLPDRTKYANLSAVALHNQIDADVNGQYAQFTYALDAASFGGASGDGITVTSSNVTKLFTNSKRLLQRSSIMVDMSAKFTGVKQEDSQKDLGVAVISPDIYQNILERLDGKDSPLGDTVGIQGHCGRYMGHDLFVSNALAWSGVLGLATNPTDGDTIVINGVTLTAKSTVDAGVTAGQFKIASTVDLTRANLTAFINAGGATTVADSTNAGYNAVSSTPDSNGFSDQDRLTNITATNSNSADTMSLVALGKGFVVVSETLTAAADTWATNTQIQHALIGVSNAIDLVIQKSPSLEIKDRDGKVGKDVVTWVAYGIKVFNDGKPKMVDVKVRTDAYSA